MPSSLDITQIGSIPFDDVDAAIEYSFQHSIPFLPELPKLSKSEFILTKISTKGIATDAFIKRTNIELPSRVKIQFIGATTLKTYSNGFSFQEYSSHLINQLDYFRNSINSSIEILVSFDDPAPFDSELLDSTIDIIKAQNYQKMLLGIHSCSDNNWEAVFQRDLNFVSFDLSLSKDSLFTESFGEFLNNDGILLVGSIPTLGEYDLMSVIEDTKSFLQKVDSKNIVITPACGIGLKTYDDSTRYLSDLKSIAQELI